MTKTYSHFVVVVILLLPMVMSCSDKDALDGGAVRNSHDRGAFPHAVRITLQLTDDRHLQEYDGVDDNDNGIVDDPDETGDSIGQTFQHVAYLGDRS